MLNTILATLYITYCSINSNTASQNCIGISDGKEYVIDTCNIINNVGPNTIFCDKQTTIRNCCILNNDSPTFYFFIYKVPVTIYDSCVEGSLSGISTINVITNSDKFYLHDLIFTSTAEYCYSGIDKVGELTPTPILHHRTVKMKDVYRGYRPPFF